MQLTMESNQCSLFGLIFVASHSKPMSLSSMTVSFGLNQSNTPFLSSLNVKCTLKHYRHRAGGGTGEARGPPLLW